MQRIIPFALVGGLTASVAVAAALGAIASPSNQNFSQRSGTTVAQADLRLIVLATLRAHSFTMKENGLTVIYQAPDRFKEVDPGPSSEIQIGSHTFSSEASPDHTWIEDPPSGGDPGVDAPREELHRLLSLPDVRRHGSTFVTSRTVNADSFVRGAPGQAIVTETVLTESGYVRSDTVNVAGRFPRAPPMPTCSACVTIGLKFPTATTFSAINASPPVDTPLAADVLRRTVVSTRTVDQDHLVVYEWSAPNVPFPVAGFNLTSRSGKQITGGYGGVDGSLPLPLFSDGGGGGGDTGTWSDDTVTVSSGAITLVRLVHDGKTLDAMAPARSGSTRFVILAARVPKVGHLLIQGLNHDGKVVASTPFR
jgi:hypothetical protein